jgi:hypothetical protein
MKAVRIVLLIFCATFFVTSIALAGEYMTKEEKRKSAKEAITAGYAAGTIFNSEKDCQRVMSETKKAYLQKGRQWDKGVKLFSDVIFKSCILGYTDKVNGQYTLPTLLRLVDIAVDSH